MKSIEIRQQFLDFFKNKAHQIVPSAPMVLKNDPTLMFTNAGMNQFKDLFLGNAPITFPRAADTQKCLRVSGKHNDLEEVGHDTYHHTMFEMLGNWSFGDYFKKEAIDWAWELLTQVYKINPENLYATYFGGNKEDKLDADVEAFELWKQYLPEERILPGSKKDNFWEMGDVGPCGPCSEIHIDIRDENEKSKISGRELVNKDNPQVIEIWNLVFIQFNRKADNSLVSLPQKHVDTGMGFERLCMALQNKKSNYDTDVFQPIIQKVVSISGIPYGTNNQTDIAMRVIADHVRAVSFAIADGQLPSNTGAGYVIRRILRRAIRYGFSFLNIKNPFIFELVEILKNQMGSQFPELSKQHVLIAKIIKEEEESFLHTLEIGIIKFDNYTSKKPTIIEGDFAFELYDTYGFPIDLTQLLSKEKQLNVDMEGFTKCLNEQKERSRQATKIEAEDWIEIRPIKEVLFIGYDQTTAEASICKYRKIKAKNKELFQIVLDSTPFYAESGGQAGDKGSLHNEYEKIQVINTIKENNLIIHIVDKLPENPKHLFTASVDIQKRRLTENNHSATHLLHAALRQIIGEHVEQKGSLVNEERLRFDFSHYSKLSSDEIAQVEKLVNQKIRENITLEEHRATPIDEAKKMGAMALFGEKYGDFVRVIAFDKSYSVELCGGTHVKATGQIGLIKIISESAIAAGIRRIEAVTADGAESYINQELLLLNEIKEQFKAPQNILKHIIDLKDENIALQKQIDALNAEKAKQLKDTLLNNAETINDFKIIITRLDLDPNIIKDIAFQLKNQCTNLFMVFASVHNEKPSLTVALSDNLCKEKNLNASTIVRELAKEINGGGGGQPGYATAGGKDCNGLGRALEKAKGYIQ